METREALEQRLRHSCRTLRAWTWMSTVSDRTDEIIDILRDEALALVDLGRQHPDQARRIGSIICYYRRLIEQLKSDEADPA